MIDFEIPDDVKAAARPASPGSSTTTCCRQKHRSGRGRTSTSCKELQGKARAEGLWCPFVPVEWGGMGLGHLANAIVQIEVGRSFSMLAAWALNCMGPQDATMFTLIEHGTEAQKERYLRPLVDGDIRICFSMTEKAAGADATGHADDRRARRRPLGAER